MATFEAAMLVVESAYTVTKASPVAGTDSIYLRLTQPNSFSVQADPKYTDISFGGGEDILVESLSDTMDVKGTLKTVLYPTQANLLLNWALTRINTGQTAPWTTTEPPGDLASASVYHAYQRSDGTLRRTRYAGGKVAKLTLTGSRNAPVWNAQLDLIFSKQIGNTYDASSDPDATEFPLPQDTDLPMGPYMFSETSGGLLIGSGAGTVRTQYETLTLTVTNMIDARPFESRFVQVAAFRGRRATLDSVLRLKSTPDDRTAFESSAAQRAQLTITKASPAHSVVINLQSSNKLLRLQRDLQLNKLFTYNMQVGNVRDATAGTDIGLTVI